MQLIYIFCSGLALFFFWEGARELIDWWLLFNALWLQIFTAGTESNLGTVMGHLLVGKVKTRFVRVSTVLPITKKFLKIPIFDYFPWPFQNYLLFLKRKLPLPCLHHKECDANGISRAWVGAVPSLSPLI